MIITKPNWIESFEKKSAASLPIHPNIVSTAKIALAAPILLLASKQVGILPNYPWIIIGGLLLYGLFDYLDGAVARYQEKFTYFGLYFNRVTDFIVLLIISLFCVDILPVWIIFIKLFLDLLRIIMYIAGKRTPETRMWTGINYTALFSMMIISQGWSPGFINAIFVYYILWLNISFSIVGILYNLNILQKRFIADALSGANLLCGIFSMIFASKNRIDVSLLFLMLGAAFDGFDGAAARKFGGTRWGVYSDDIADCINYGIAPGVALYLIISGVQGFIIGMFYSCFTIGRLIFFTLNKDYSDPNYFCGVPSTVGALMTLCSLILFENHLLYVGLTVGVACIQMVSFDTHYRHLGRVLASNRRIIYGMPIMIVLLMAGDFFMNRMIPVSIIFSGCLIYGFLPTIKHFNELIRRKGTGEV